MARYPSIKDGDRVIPRMKGYKMACCDCGLIHKFDFEVMLTTPSKAGAFTMSKPRNQGRLQVVLYPTRDERATAQFRRARYPK